jgi:two-component system sensor histidine kinase RegB
MAAKNSSARQPGVVNLRRLYLLRNIAIAGQAGAVALVHYGLAMPLPIGVIAWVIGVLVVANGLTRWRLTRPWPLTDLELFCQLLLDIGALTVLLYFTGGASNPFVFLYLIPLAIAAISLGERYTWSIAAVTIGCYSLLMFYFEPLPPPAGSLSAFNLHLIGMWLTFVVSAALFAYFVARFSATVRARDHALALARENALRDEQILALGTLAAGVAHELGTPLSTMAVVVNEMEHSTNQAPEALEGLALLREQIKVCKEALSAVLWQAGSGRAQIAARRPAGDFLAEVLHKWQIIRPSARYQIDTPTGEAPMIVVEETLSQALINLLNNAADASPEDIEVHAYWSSTAFMIDILDRGAGLSAEALQGAGQVFFTTKPKGKGFGLGVFLANATVERFGGKVELFNREGGGACTRLELPLDSQAYPLAA